MAFQYKSGHGSSRSLTSPLETGVPIWMARIVSTITAKRCSGVMPAAPCGTRPLQSTITAGASAWGAVGQVCRYQDIGAQVSKLLVRQGRAQTFQIPDR